MPPSLQSVSDALNHVGQQHLLQYVDQLDPAQQENLLQQIQEINFSLVEQLFENRLVSTDPVMTAELQPPPALRLTARATDSGITRKQALIQGEQLLRDGKIAAVIVAGGQGSRLGFAHPKGMLPVGPLSNRTLFQFIADKILGLQRYYDTRIPLMIMTSPMVDDETRHYFRAQDHFGLTDSIRFFCQNTMPTVDAQSGKVLLQAPGEISLSPNGHGGMLDALVDSGLLDQGLDAGIESFFFGQIDNPLAPVCCPELLGFHSLTNAEVTLQAIAKETAEDRTGNILQINGQTQMVEYSEMPLSIAKQTEPDGTLQFWAANIAVHVFCGSFMKRIATHTDGLDYHTAHKTVPYLNSAGKLIHPAEPNAIKFERFIFDLLPLSQQTTVIEANRPDVFAPVKNHETTGFDTPSTSKQAISALHGSWLREAGVQVGEGIIIEIDPSWAINQREVTQRSDLPQEVTKDTFFTSS